jgi:putative NADPH-quinone reductase
MSAVPPSLPLVLLASARPAGDTAAFVRQVFADSAHELIDLAAAPLYPYSYLGHYPADDTFPDLAQRLVKHTTIVLATPVYWYAMSGMLKTFFDRLTDLVTIAKPLGRQLRGRRLLVLAVGADAALPAGFEEPFRLTANYFSMDFGGLFYHSQNHPPSADELTATVQAFRLALMAPVR